MKVPIKIKCSNCDLSQPVPFKLVDKEVAWKCNSCGEENCVPFGPDFTIGQKLLQGKGDRFI